MGVVAAGGGELEKSNRHGKSPNAISPEISCGVTNRGGGGGGGVFVAGAGICNTGDQAGNGPSKKTGTLIIFFVCVLKKIWRPRLWGVPRKK
jgi:hypothetical protein